MNERVVPFEAKMKKSVAVLSLPVVKVLISDQIVPSPTMNTYSVFSLRPVISARMSLADLNAVSPEVIGHATTPMIASAPPIGPMRVVEIS